MIQAVRIVLVEDNNRDVALCQDALDADGLAANYERVTTREELRTALAGFQPDVVLSDFFLRRFDGLRAIAEVRSRCPTVPVIIVTRSLDEETAADCLNAGALDFVTKDQLDRLPLMVRRALERRRETESLRMVEDQLRKVSLAVEQSPTVVMMTDPNGVIEYVNPRFTALTGYTRHEAVGRTANILKSGRTPPETYQDLWSTVRAGREWHGELLNRKKNGEYFWERTAISPVRGSDGNVTHLVCVKEDITARKRRERALRAMPVLGSALELVKTRSECFDTTLRVLLEEFGGHVACAFTLGPEGVVVHRSCHGPEGETRTPAGFPGQELLRAMERDGRPNVTELDDGEGVHHSVLGFPIALGGELTATFWVGQRLGGPVAWGYDAEDLDLLTNLMPIIAGALERTALNEQTDRRLGRLLAMKAIDRAIAGSNDLRVTLEILQDHLNRELDVDASAVMMYNPHLRELELVSVRGAHTGGPRRMDLGQPISGLAALERRIVLAGEGQEYPVPSHLLAEAYQFVVAAPLIAKGAIVGTLTALRRKASRPDPEWLDYLQALADQTAVALESARLFQDLQRSNDELSVAYDATIEGWVRALDLRDQETEGHTQRVTEMSLRLARALGVPEQELIHLRRGALLHDIGKMAVPDAVLRKPGVLTPEERAIVETHTTIAYEMLSPIRYLKPALSIPWCHHERWDGTGYPRHLARDQIPFAARIFAVVDVWDALRSDRVYRAGWPDDKVRAYLRDGAGSHFDPEVVPVFLELLGGGRR